MNFPDGNAEYVLNTIGQYPNTDFSPRQMLKLRRSVNHVGKWVVYALVSRFSIVAAMPERKD